MSVLKSSAATVLVNRMPMSELEALKFALEDLETRVKDKMYDMPELVEIGSRLTIHEAKLDKLKEEFRETLKAEMLDRGVLEQEGRTCTATITKLTKERLNTKTVREFLGSQLSKFLVMSDEVQLKFHPKG